MKYVLDASIAVAAEKLNEPLHAAARARVDRVLSGVDEICVPAIFAGEVASALTRSTTRSAADILGYVRALLADAEVITLGPRAALAIAAVATQSRLRAADAAYVWTARRAGVALVTADEELVKRSGALCSVERA